MGCIYIFICVHNTQTNICVCVAIIINKEEVTNLSLSEDKGGVEMRRGRVKMIETIHEILKKFTKLRHEKK